MSRRRSRRSFAATSSSDEDYEDHDNQREYSPLTTLPSSQKQQQQQFFEANDDQLEIRRIDSISVKNVTSKSGLTQAAHHVCKNTAFDVAVGASAALRNVDFTRCVISCRLVYDGGAPPFKQVDFPAKTKPLSYTAAVDHTSFVLSIRLGVLSSQVEGELFRLEIGCSLPGADSPLLAFTPPISVVSKPYLALRKEGERGKPKPKRRRAAMTAAADAVPAADTSALLASLRSIVAEQAAQRQLLEKLMSQNKNDSDEPVAKRACTSSSGSSSREIAPTKRLSAAVDALVSAYDAINDVEQRAEVLRALLPSRLATAIAPTDACEMFGAQGCPHKRELDRLDNFYSQSVQQQHQQQHQQQQHQQQQQQQHQQQEQNPELSFTDDEEDTGLTAQSLFTHGSFLPDFSFANSVGV